MSKLIKFILGLAIIAAIGYAAGEVFTPIIVFTLGYILGSYIAGSTSRTVFDYEGFVRELEEELGEKFIERIGEREAILNNEENENE